MKEKRRFVRFETELEAQYISQDGKRDWEKCAVVSLGRKGIGVRFQSLFPKKCNPLLLKEC